MGAKHKTPLHAAKRREYKILVDKGKAHCWRCGKWINPVTPWQAGHDDRDPTGRTYIGPEHQSCGSSAGATKGNYARAARARAARETGTGAQPQSRAW